MENDRIPLSRPFFCNGEAEAVADVLGSGWVSQGPAVERFEAAVAAYVGASHAVATSSCTSALHLALVALDIQPGDEVVVPSHTFIATVNAIRYVGATPVLVDIDPRTYNSGPSEIAPAISRRTRAILCVHQVGMPCDLNGLIELVANTGIHIIEDAACALGSEIQTHGNEWEPIGAPHGSFATFSFHGRKVLSTGEGGMITTADPDLSRAVKIFRHHGMSISDLERERSSVVVQESYDVLGYNYRLSDIQAAVGCAQMERLSDFVCERRALAAAYSRRLEATGLFEAPHEPTWARSNWQSFCVRLPDGVDQQTVITDMNKHGVATKRGIMCIHREPAYSKSPGDWRQCGDLRNSELAQDRTILLPMFNSLSLDQVDRVVDALREAVSR